MFHIELRQFPHNHSRFNLSEEELRALVDPWVRERWVEMGERKWNCNQAKLTILEGPQLAVQQLSMGRGWRTAQREGEDVTERLLAAARSAIQQAPQAPVLAGTQAAGMGAGGVLGDPLALGVQIASLLGPDATRLLEAWRTAAVATPGLAPSESLARAEQQLRPPDASPA
jgi:hypothetical protein